MLMKEEYQYIEEQKNSIKNHMDILQEQESFADGRDKKKLYEATQHLKKAIQILGEVK